MKRFFNILAVALLLMGMVTFYYAIREYRPFRQENFEKNALQKTVILNKEEKGDTPFNRTIDFQSLSKINNDIVAWVYVPGTQIDYPILIGESNSEYLTKNFEGKKSNLGAIFSFADTSKDFSDAHICLFGHNMRSAQMFGELKKYKDKDYAKNHRKIYCYTQEKISEYEVFSVYECKKTDFTFQHKMRKNSEEFFTLFDDMIEKNIVDFENSFFQADDKQIITLSCCSEYQRTRNRMTVHFIETGFAR